MPFFLLVYTNIYLKSNPTLIWEIIPKEETKRERKQLLMSSTLDNIYQYLSNVLDINYLD